MGLFKWLSKKKEDYRRSLRREHSLRVNYQIGNGTPRSDCSTKDLSQEGIRLYLHERLAIGTTLKLHIYFQNNMEPVLVFGKIAWTKESSDREYLLEAGIEFDFIDPSLRSKIQNYVQSIFQE